MKTLTKRQRTRPKPDDLRSVSDHIVRLTAAAPVEGGLRIDWDRLDDNEAGELVELTRKADDRVEGFRLNRLSAKELRRWESLVEVGADAPGVFASAREEAELRAATAELAAQARRPSPRPRYEEAGAIVLPRGLTFDLLTQKGETLWIEHLGLLVWTLAALENGVALNPRGRIEGGGDDAVLVIDMSMGIGVKFHDDETMGRWLEYFAHLGTLELLRVERRGRELLVGRGRLVLEAASRRAGA
jgi:hypothetical protein